MIYLDSAATTMEKPASVPSATAWAMTHMASPGRGGHGAGMRAADTLYALRETAAQLFDVPNPEQVVLTYNATHALNLAIHALVRPGHTVLISGYEHNAVTRPLCARGDLTIRVAQAPVFDQAGMLAAFEEELRRGVDVGVCTHVSNVFGFIMPIGELARMCRERGVPLIVDASQSAGCLPVRLSEWGAAYVAMPGHKGLYGPQGTGLLLCGEGYMPRPLLEGGTGSLSRLQEMPDFLPDRLEAGTHNVHGAVGLLEGLRFVRRLGPGQAARHEMALLSALAGRLRRTGRYRVFDGVGTVLSVIPLDTSPEELADTLAQRGVAVRAGLHCAPLAHITAGTVQTGTLRFSMSVFNTMEEVEQVAEMLS